MSTEIEDDLPRHLTMADYDDARQRLVDACARAGMPSGACGFFGTIRHAGISDLDVLAVGSVDQLRKLSAHVDEMRRSSPDLREILWHPPVYLLHDAAQHARRLHTFEHLDGVGDLLPRAETGAGQGRDHLHRVWALFLVRATSDLLSTRRRVSLRTLLLVHKNLEHSRRHMMRKLSAPEATMPFESDELRDAALRGSRLDEMLERFATAASAMMATYDQTHDRPQAPPDQGAGLRPLRLTRATIAHRGRRTTVRRFGRLRLMGLRGPDLALAHRYRGAAGLGSDEERRHLDATQAVAKIYRSTGLAFPFIGPLGLRPPES